MTSVSFVDRRSERQVVKRMRHRLRIGVSGAGELMPLGCSRSSPRTPAEFGLQHPVCGRQTDKFANHVDAAQERATECHCARMASRTVYVAVRESRHRRVMETVRDGLRADGLVPSMAKSDTRRLIA